MSTYTEEFVMRLAQNAYREGCASFTADLCHAALLVIDMQAEFVQPGLSPFWVPEATRIIPLLAGVLAAARQAGRPVIHTAFAATYASLDRPMTGQFMPNRFPDVPCDGLFRQPCFPPELQPAPEELLILKPSYGAFYDTPLDTILRNLGCDTVVITGTMTNLCCGMTARQAYERGYKVIFAADATATNSAEIQAAELQTLRYGFAQVRTAAEIIQLFETVSA